MAQPLTLDRLPIREMSQRRRHLGMFPMDYHNISEAIFTYASCWAFEKFNYTLSWFNFYRYSTVIRLYGDSARYCKSSKQR